MVLAVRGTAVAKLSECEFLDGSDAITGSSGAAEVAARLEGVAFGFHRPEARRRERTVLLGLVEAVRRSGIDETGVVHEPRLQPHAFDGTWSHAVAVEGFWPAPATLLDARTGRVLPQ
jgi:hypothetical protein